jgi:hypothetical protein
MMASTFEGYSLGNATFGNGLDDRWEFPVATERPYSYARGSWAPTGLKGFYEWHGDLTASVNNVARTGSIATITTAAAHGFRVGDTVTVSGLTATALNGTYTITGASTTTTFTYTTATTGTIASTADSGTALVETGYWAVTDFLSQGSTTEYNTPGNANYNADESIDFIIASAEDPTS